MDPARQTNERHRRQRGMLRMLAAVVMATMVLGSTGCTGRQNLVASARLSNGYTLVLPGLLGRNFWDDNLVEGLERAETPTAIEIHDWTRGGHMLAFNMFDDGHRQRQIGRIIDKITHYQDRYPGRPVYLIGHSAGARLAVQVLERLPEDRSVTSAVLLAAPLGRSYDLQVAQSRTQRGLHNFYSPYDVAIGQVWSSTMRINEGQPLCAAAFGFQAPRNLDARQRQQYQQKLVQHEFSWDMLDEGHLGGHFGWTSSAFVQQRIAPILTTPISAAEGTTNRVPQLRVEPVSSSRS